MNWRRGEEAGTRQRSTLCRIGCLQGKEVGGGFGWKERNFLDFQMEESFEN